MEAARMRRILGLAIVCIVLATARVGVAADQPLLGTKLVLRRTGAEERLSLVLRDPAVLFPAPGSADDPGTGTPGGATVEMFSAGEGAATLAVPAGLGTPGWRTTTGTHARHRFVNRDAPDGTSPVRSLLLKQGRRLTVVARSTGLPLAIAQGMIGIRVTTGGVRNCALFDPASIVRDVPGRFVARRAAAPADCSDATLGAPPPCGDSSPTCDGTCAAGEECAATYGGLQCVCLPTGSTPCGTPGSPTCGGACPSSQQCVPVFLPPSQPGGVSCGCGFPACGNGSAFGIDDFGQGGCFLVLCDGTYPTCGGACGDGGECSAAQVAPPLVPSPLTFCFCALPVACCNGGFTCPSGEVCTQNGTCSCSSP
jgi:hypothetical protein